MELPLTEPCPQCGADMEPRKVARRGRMIYECPECGYQMEMTEARTGRVAEDAPGGTALDAEDEDDNDEDEEDDENGDEDKEESAG